MVDFREFLTAAINQENYLTPDNIENMFKALDKNDDGDISMTDLKFYLPSKKWPNVFNEAFGEEGKTNISKDEFIKVMSKYGIGCFA